MLGDIEPLQAASRSDNQPINTATALQQAIRIDGRLVD
jgi:hypothetical protein